MANPEHTNVRVPTDKGKFYTLMSSRVTDFSSAYPNLYGLQMGYVKTATLDSLLKASQFNVLGIVRHDRRSGSSTVGGGCPVVYLDLPQFSGHPLTEVWTSRVPVTYHQTEGIHYAMTDEVLFGSLQLEEHPGTRLDVLTYSAYRRLLLQIRALDYPHLMRMWKSVMSVPISVSRIHRPWKHSTT